MAQLQVLQQHNVKMKISELKTNQGDVEIEAEVMSIEEPRTFNKFGKDLRVANATIKDDSGEIQLTLWNEDIDKIKQGMKIKISKGYVKEFNNQKQITTGKFGSFEVLGNDNKKAPTGPPEASEEEQVPDQASEPEETLL